MPPTRIGPAAIAARILLVPYVTVLALIVWLPESAASRVTGIVYRLARFASEHTGISMNAGYTAFEFLANIALFTPFGLLVAAAWPRTNAWWIFLLGFSASAAIELVQTMIPGRVTALSDVIANTLGMVVGCLIARVFASAPRPATTR